MIQNRIQAQRHHVPDGRHDPAHALRVQLQHAIQNADLVVAEGLLTRAMELEEGLELGFFVGVRGVHAKDAVEELGDGPSDGS